MCPRSGNPDADPRKGPGRRSQWNQGRWMAKYGITSWLPGDTEYAGFAQSHNAYGGRIKDNLVSLWSFGEGTGTTLNDLVAKTYKQDLRWDSSQAVNMTWVNSSTYSRWYGAFDPSAGGAAQDLEPTDNGLPYPRSGELYFEMARQRDASAINEFSVETWIHTSSITQSPYKFIFGMTLDGDFYNNYNYILAQGGSGTVELGTDGTASSVYSIATRTRPKNTVWGPLNYTGVNWKTTAAGVAKTQLQHLVMTAKGEDNNIRMRLWVDGNLELDELEWYYGGSNGDNKYNWTRHWYPSTNDGVHKSWCTKVGRSYDFSSVGLAAGWNDWNGGMYTLATYDHALTKGEVLTNYAAGIVNNPPPGLPVIGLTDPLSSTLHNCSACTLPPYNSDTVTIGLDANAFRAVPLNVNYSLSSPDGLVEGTHYVDKTPHGYATIAATDWETNITLSANPTSVSSGEIHVTLSSTSVGTLSGNLKHVVTLKSYPGSAVWVSGQGSRTILTDYVSGAPMAFSLNLSDGTSAIVGHDVSAECWLSATSTNIGSYQVQPFILTIPAGQSISTCSIVVPWPSTGNRWIDGDSFSMTVSAAGCGDCVSHNVSANVSELITISNDQNFNKPGPGNTGCNLQDSQLKDPTYEWWYDSANNFVSGNPGVIQGYKFNQAVLSTAAAATHDLIFWNCVFDGRDANGKDSVEQVIVGDQTNYAENLKLYYCTVRNAKTTLMSGVSISTIHRCDFFEAGFGGIHGLGASAGCNINDNWVHQIGKKSDFGGIAMYGISLWGATSGVNIIRNYIDTRRTDLWTCDSAGTIGPGTTINCHAPHVSAVCDGTFDDYTPNGCIEVRSLKANVGGNVNVSANWFGGWETCHTYGAWSPTYTYDASVTIELNRYERDFTGDFLVTTGFDTTGGLTHWTTNSSGRADTWEDTGQPIFLSAQPWSDLREWSLLACEVYGNCPPGSYDPNLACSYYDYTC